MAKSRKKVQGKWMIKPGSWVAKLGRLVAKSGRQVQGGRLVAREMYDQARELSSLVRKIGG